MNFLTRFCATCGAETNFEKARLAATYGNTQAPGENDINAIIECLRGDDLQTNSKIGFGALIRRLKQQNREEQGWILIIKSLIIIDRYRQNEMRCVNENVLVNEFLEVDLPFVEQRQEVSQKNKNLLIDQLIQKYYRFIKFKCYHYRKKNSLKMSNSDRVLYFLGLDSSQIINELTIVLEFVNRAFQIADTSKNGHLRFKLNQFLFLTLLGDLMKFYGICVIGLNQLLQILSTLTIEQLLLFKEISKQIYSFSTRLEEFINACRFISGFQDIQLDYKIQNNFVDLITQYISHQGYQQGENDISENGKSEPSFQERELKRQSTFFPVNQKTSPQPQKQEIFQNAFNDNLYHFFENNYSTNYEAIEIQFTKQQPIIPIVDDYLSKIDKDNTLFQVEQPITFTNPVVFDEDLFDSFKNQYYL